MCIRDRVDNTIVSLKDLDLWNQNFLASKKETNRDKLPYTIFATQSTPLKRLNEVVNELKKLNISDTKISLACLTPNPTDLENLFRIFPYKKINFSNLELTLQESIESF